MIEHVVRRGLQHAGSMNLLKRAAEYEPLDMPTWGIVLLAVTFLVNYILMIAVDYTLGDVIATLAMVETPSAAITVSTPEEPASREEKEGLLETAPTITLVRQKPLTSSIRATIKHLKAQAGRWAGLRGFGYRGLHSVAFSMAFSILITVIPFRSSLGRVTASAMAGAICAPIHAGWTNKVISAPSDMTFWQRIPSRSSWKVLALPAAVNAAMPYFALFLAHASVCVLGLVHVQNIGDFDAKEWTWFIVRWIIVLVVSVSGALFLCLPAIVTLVRTEASLLPDNQEAIVPFDRTFDGKVVPEILGGTGALKFLDAWRSFNWEARRRLLKHYVKTFFVVFSIGFAMMHVLAFELLAIMGPQIGQFLGELKKEGYLS